MRRFFASTLLALGLTGGIASAGTWHHNDYRRGPAYRDARVGAFNRGFERGRVEGRRDGRHEVRRDIRSHRGWDRR